MPRRLAVGLDSFTTGPPIGQCFERTLRRDECTGERDGERSRFCPQLFTGPFAVHSSKLPMRVFHSFGFDRDETGLDQQQRGSSVTKQ
jgi:hypothetical protein